MTADQYRQALSALNLTQSGAGRLFGVDPVSSRKWATGVHEVPSCIAILLRLMLAGEVTAEQIQRVSQPGG